MCGGANFSVKNISQKELEKFYTSAQAQQIKQAGIFESFFWEKQPVLPISMPAGTQLRLWGNKSQGNNLPLTGWARIESLQSGKWDRWQPEPVDLPLERGYEKKAWFKFKRGAKGILVKNEQDERVYIITQNASAEYRQATGHDREPVGDKAY